MKKLQILLAAISTLAMVGCGANAGPERYDVSGRVTFQNKAVPSGHIQFLPDAGKGNSGPAGFATIRDGAYDTAKQGKGGVGGPQIVVISGNDGRPVPGGENNEGRSLFSDYKTSVELPRQNTAKDFNIPDRR